MVWVRAVLQQHHHLGGGERDDALLLRAASLRAPKLAKLQGGVRRNQLVFDGLGEHRRQDAQVLLHVHFLHPRLPQLVGEVLDVPAADVGQLLFAEGGNQVPPAAALVVEPGAALQLVLRLGEVLLGVRLVGEPLRLVVGEQVQLVRRQGAPHFLRQRQPGAPVLHQHRSAAGPCGGRRASTARRRHFCRTVTPISPPPPPAALSALPVGFSSISVRMDALFPGTVQIAPDSAGFFSPTFRGLCGSASAPCPSLPAAVGREKALN